MVTTFSTTTTKSVSVPATYNAALYETYGNIQHVLQLKDVKTEPLPSANHVRIHVHAVGLNPIDYKLAERLARVFSGGASPTEDKPFRIGYDAAGVVVEVGDDVSPNQLQVGDEVVMMTPTGHNGTLAEYVSVDAQYVVRKPTNLSFVQAAGVPLVSSTSYQALVEHAKLQKGERVLVLGGSTSVGMFAIQYAKAIGAAEVITTASTAKTDLMTSLGADRVVDYTTQQWHQQLAPHSIDVIYDCAVEPQAWDTHAQEILKKVTGRFVTLVGRGPTPAESKYGATRSAVFGRACGGHLRAICELLECGDVKPPVVDSVFALEEVKDAFARVQSGRAVGKVVVAVRREDA